MKKLVLIIMIVLSLTGIANLLVNADTTEIEAELGGYNDIFKLSEITIGNSQLNVYELERLGEEDIIKKLNDSGLNVYKDTNSKHNIYIIKNGDIKIGDILINEYVTSLSLYNNTKILGGMEIENNKCRDELEYILKYSEDNEDTWIGYINNKKAMFDWCIDIGDEDEYNALGIIYNENELQLDEYRIRYGFNASGKIINLQFNLFHKLENGEKI